MRYMARLIASAKEVKFSTMSICWLVCELDYTKTTERTSAKFGLRKCLGPDWIPRTFCVDLDKGMDPGIFSHFPCVREAFFKFLVNFSWSNASILTKKLSDNTVNAVVIVKPPSCRWKSIHMTCFIHIMFISVWRLILSIPEFTLTADEIKCVIALRRKWVFFWV